MAQNCNCVRLYDELEDCSGLKIWTLYTMLDKEDPCSKCVDIFDKILTNYAFDIHLNRDILLQKCVRSKNNKILVYLIDSGIDFISPFNRIGEYSEQEPDLISFACRYHCISSVAYRKKSEKIIEILLRNGVDPNSADCTYFLYCCRYGSLELIQLFIDLGANVSIQKNLPLYIAVKYKNLELVKLLIKNGADINDLQSHINANTKFELINYLTDLGADPIDLTKIWY